MKKKAEARKPVIAEGSVDTLYSPFGDAISFWPVTTAVRELDVTIKELTEVVKELTEAVKSLTNEIGAAP